MNCLQDQQNCRYLQFLLLLCGLLLMLAFGNGYFQLQQTRQLLLQQQQTMVSALLAQKVDAAIITQALCSTDTTTAGKALLQQLGFTKQLPLWLFPGLQEKNMVLPAAAIVWNLGLLRAAIGLQFSLSPTAKPAISTSHRRRHSLCRRRFFPPSAPRLVRHPLSTICCGGPFGHGIAG